MYFDLNYMKRLKAYFLQSRLLIDWYGLKIKCLLYPFTKMRLIVCGTNLKVC